MLEDSAQGSRSIAQRACVAESAEAALRDPGKKSGTIIISHGADRTLTASLQRWHESA